MRLGRRLQRRPPARRQRPASTTAASSTRAAAALAAAVRRCLRWFLHPCTTAGTQSRRVSLRCRVLVLLLHRRPLLLQQQLPRLPCRQHPATTAGPRLHSREVLGGLGSRRRNRSSNSNRKAAVAAGAVQLAGSRLLACLPLARVTVAAGPGQQVQPALLHLLLQARHRPPLRWRRGQEGTPVQVTLPPQQQLAVGLLSGGALSAGPGLSAGSWQHGCSAQPCTGLWRTTLLPRVQPHLVPAAPDAPLLQQQRQRAGPCLVATRQKQAAAVAASARVVLPTTLTARRLRAAAGRSVWGPRGSAETRRQSRCSRHPSLSPAPAAQVAAAAGLAGSCHLQQEVAHPVAAALAPTAAAGRRGRCSRSRVSLGPAAAAAAVAGAAARGHLPGQQLCRLLSAVGLPVSAVRAAAAGGGAATVVVRAVASAAAVAASCSKQRCGRLTVGRGKPAGRVVPAAALLRPAAEAAAGAPALPHSGPRVLVVVARASFSSLLRTSQRCLLLAAATPCGGTAAPGGSASRAAKRVVAVAGRVVVVVGAACGGQAAQESCPAAAGGRGGVGVSIRTAGVSVTT